MDHNASSRYAIVGGSGFLGQQLLHALLQKYPDDPKLQIKVIDRAPSLDAVTVMFPEDFHAPQVSLHWGVDISQAAHLEGLFKDVDVVLHLAAAIAYGKKNKALLEATNIKGCQHIIEEVKRAGVNKIIHVSSCATLGCLEDYAYYAQSKRLGEQYILAQASATLQVITAIPGIMIGPGPGHHASTLPFEVVLSNRFSVVPEGGGNIIDVRDAAQALLMLTHPRVTQGQYLLMSHNVEHKELLLRIARCANRPLRVFALPSWLAKPLGYLATALEWISPRRSPFSKEGLLKAFKYRYYSHEKTMDDLGWKPLYTLDETLQDTLAWIRRGSHPTIPAPRAVQDPVFVTGANGFLGQHLVHELITRGHEVHILTRDEQRSQHLFSSRPIHCVKGSLMEPETLLIPRHAHVYHCAGITGSIKVSEKAYHHVNVEGTAHLLNAALKSEAQGFHFVSSVSALGAQGRASQPMTEETHPAPKTYYGKSKLAAEQWLWTHTPQALPLTIVRPPLIYGPGQMDRSGAALLLALCQRTWIPKVGDPQTVIPLVYVKNLAAGLVDLSLKHTGKELFHVADPTPYTMAEIAAQFDEQRGRPSRFIELPYPLAAALGWSADALAWTLKRDLGLSSELIDNMALHGSTMSITKALAFGYQPKVDLASGLSLTLGFVVK